MKSQLRKGAGRLVAVLATALAVVGLVTVAPASADQAAEFGPFASSRDCGASMYITSVKIKYWACAYHDGGGTKTGITVHNYGTTTRNVHGRWQRWMTLWIDGSGTSANAQVDPTPNDDEGPNPVWFVTGTSLAAGQTKTLFDYSGDYAGYDYDWDWIQTFRCDDAASCYVKGTRGYVDVWNASDTALQVHGEDFAYSPLQSQKSWCKEGPEVPNWPNLNRC